MRSSTCIIAHARTHAVPTPRTEHDHERRSPLARGRAGLKGYQQLCFLAFESSSATHTRRAPRTCIIAHAAPPDASLPSGLRKVLSLQGSPGQCLRIDLVVPSRSPGQWLLHRPGCSSLAPTRRLHRVVQKSTIIVGRGHDVVHDAVGAAVFLVFRFF